MSIERLFVVLAILLASVGSSSAQRPGPEFWRRATCEPFEGRTKLEALELKYETLLYKGFTRITTVEIQGIRVDAIDMRDTRAPTRAMGIAVVLAGSGDRSHDERALIDYEEIQPLLHAIDEAAKINEMATKLVGFEARYKTHGDLELVVFRQTRSGNAVTLTAGLCDKVTESLTLDELAKFRAMIVDAKQRLDEIR